MGNTEGVRRAARGPVEVEVVCTSALVQQREASPSLQTAAAHPELCSDDHAADAQQPTDKYKSSNTQSWH